MPVVVRDFNIAASVQTLASVSLTPAADSLWLIVATASQPTSTYVFNWGISGGAESYLAHDGTGGTDNLELSDSFATGFGDNTWCQRVWTQQFGASPAARTVTFDPDNDGADVLSGIGFVIIEITGHDPAGPFAQSAAAHTQDPPLSGPLSNTTSFGAAPSRHQVYVAIAENNPAATFAAEPAGWTEVDVDEGTVPYSIQVAESSTNTATGVTVDTATGATYHLAVTLFEINPAPTPAEASGTAPADATAVGTAARDSTVTGDGPGRGASAGAAARDSNTTGTTSTEATSTGTASAPAVPANATGAASAQANSVGTGSRPSDATGSAPAQGASTAVTGRDSNVTGDGPSRGSSTGTASRPSGVVGAAPAEAAAVGAAARDSNTAGSAPAEASSTGASSAPGQANVTGTAPATADAAGTSGRSSNAAGSGPAEAVGVGTSSRSSNVTGAAAAEASSTAAASAPGVAPSNVTGTAVTRAASAGTAARGSFVTGAAPAAATSIGIAPVSGTHPEALASSGEYSVLVMAAPDGQTVMAVTDGDVVRYWEHPGWVEYSGEVADLQPA